MEKSEREGTIFEHDPQNTAWCAVCGKLEEHARMNEVYSVGFVCIGECTEDALGVQRLHEHAEAYSVTCPVCGKEEREEE